jgi:hypothetical protein
MRQRSTALAVVAAALVGLAPGLAGCGGDKHPAATSTSAASIATTPAGAPAAPAAPLPAPEVLTDVLYKLSDTTVPGAQKINLVEGATPDSAAQLDRFGKALQDSGYTPLGFTAENIAWSDSDPGNVTADVTVHSENAAIGNGFNFPMEFKPDQVGWQLSRRTADILLTFGQNQSTPPS